MGAIDAIKIAAKGDHLGTAHLFVVGRMLCNERRRAAAAFRMGGVGVQKGRIVVQARNAAALRKGADHLIGQVAGVGCQCTAVGVAGRKRPGAVLHDIPEALVRKVAHIHDHVHPFHLGQKFKALPGQTLFGLGHQHAAGVPLRACQLVFVVPCQGHHARAQLIHPAQHPHAALAAGAFLDGEHPADLSRRSIPADVCRRVHRGNGVRVCRHDPLEPVDLLQCRHQRVRPGGGVVQIDEGCKALQQIIAFL